MRRLRRPLVCAVVLAAAAALGGPRESPAQGLGISLFERYLDALRQEVGIPGLSAAIVENGTVVWAVGLGVSDVERSVRARPDTPYPIGGLSQALAATVILQCMEQGRFVIDDRVLRWSNRLPEARASVLEVMTHTSDRSRDRAFHYDPARFAALTELADWCGMQRYAVTLAESIFDRLGMVASVPGDALATPGHPLRPLFGVGALARYEAVIDRMARPYRGTRRNAPTAGVYEPSTLDTASGAVSTVLDLARFDAALDDRVLLNANSLANAWRPVTVNGVPTPAGLGWFVQTSNGQRLVWQFGEIPGAYSSLMLKLPERRLTLILLANSDGLSSPFDLEDGDVTDSLFATIFLRLMS